MSNRASRRARRVLSAAAPHVGSNVVVIAPGCEGNGFLATSMPTRSPEDLMAIETMLKEATKKLQHWRHRRIEAIAQ
jgi:hypothetical protein